MNNIAIFASGSGTNAENLIRFFRTNPHGRVKLVLSNRRDAMVLERAQKYGIEAVPFNREELYKTGKVLGLLKKADIDFIVLAGFLWLVPEDILETYDNKVVNIHPALLPKYGGKGMYGRHVHEAVIASGDAVSGITIHKVNRLYDEGDILFQATCPVEAGESPDTLAQKVHSLEYEHFPKVVEQLLQEL
jgi:phosphoribosylglycinamide formyltransferase-1